MRTLILDNHVLPGGRDLTEEAAYERMVREQAQSWVDTPNTTSMTPRQAVAAGGAARVELESLLDDLQWRNDRRAEQGELPLMDVDWIRRELGLPAGG